MQYFGNRCLSHTLLSVNYRRTNTWRTRSTKKTINLEICSACHPFFTGEQPGDAVTAAAAGSSSVSAATDLRDPRNQHSFRFDPDSMDLGRLAVNSTIGILGLWDVAPLWK